MYIGQRNPLKLPEDEQYKHFSTQPNSVKIVQNQNKFTFRALNCSKNFATTDYEGHIITKINRAISNVLKTMTVTKLNTLHTIFEVERTQL